MTAADVVEEIMTQHWRPPSEGVCRCWVCQSGREVGCRARTRYVSRENKHGRVWVDPAVRRPKGWHG